MRNLKWVGPLVLLVASASACRKEAGAPTVPPDAPAPAASGKQRPGGGSRDTATRDPAQLTEARDAATDAASDDARAARELAPLSADPEAAIAQIQALIAGAQPCQRDEQCLQVGSQCPFGCAIIVNRAQEAKVRSALEAFTQQHADQVCAYRCPAPPEPACVEGRCAARP